MEIEELIKKVSDQMQEVQSKAPTSFNVYELCGVQDKETTHSAILAGILRYKFREPLRLFIERLDPNVKLSEEELRSATIETERQISVNGESRRVDILIKAHNFIAIIENKIFTADHDQQLWAYSQWLAKQPEKKKCLIYLTLGGTPSQEGCPKDKYTALSYYKDITTWLKDSSESLQQLGLDERFRFALDQYKEFWEKWSMDTNDQIVPIIHRSKEFYKSARQIAQVFPVAKIRIIIKTLREWQQTKEEFFPCLKKAQEMSGRQYDKIIFAWNHKVQFGFEFQSQGFNYLGYGLLPEEGQNRQEMTIDLMGDKWSQTPTWPAFKWIEDVGVRDLGSNDLLCFENKERIFAALNAAFDEMVELLKQNEDIVGKRAESSKGQVDNLRKQLGQLTPFGFNSIIKKGNSTFLNGARIGNHTYGISFHLFHDVGFQTLIWENTGDFENYKDFQVISDLPEALKKEFPVVKGGDTRYWFHKEIIPFDGITAWLQKLQELLKSLQ